MLARAYLRGRGAARPFVLAGCAALAVGTLQGPVQALPAVNDLLDRGGDAGDVIVNLHAQLNMLGGLMAMLIGAGAGLLLQLGGTPRPRALRVAATCIPAGIGVYYAVGIAVSAVEAHDVTRGRTFAAAVAALEPWAALALVPAAALAGAGFAAYASAAWTMTAPQRAAGRRALAAMPSIYTGRIPRRVRRRRPISVAAYELPLGLLGFPGIGWLFAGFPFTASVLLLGGPAVAWAVIPIAFSPYGDGPLRAIGWQVELAWLPASALLSAAALYRAHRRRRLILLGSAPRTRRRGRARAYRTRVGVAAGAILLLLVSLPFVPAVAGVGSSSVRYSYEPRLTSDVTGQFLVTARGPVKLFAWSDPQSAYPADALRLHARDVRSLLVRAAAVDATAAYQVFDLDRSRSVPLVVRSRSPRTLSLVPARPLAPGRYVFTATHEGMFGGRDFAYVRVVAAGAPVTAISSKPRATAPAVIHSLLPVAAALVAALFAALLAGSFRRRPAGQKGLWALGFLLFAVATASEAVAQRTGWSPALFRTYYLAGGVLTVAYLGAGSAWLLLPRRARDRRRSGDSRAGSARRARAGDDRERPAAGERRATRPRLSLGRRPELVRQRVPDRRLALLDRAPAPRAYERVDRRRRRRRRPRDRPLAGRRLLVRVRRGAARHRADVRRLPARRGPARTSPARAFRPGGAEGDPADVARMNGHENPKLPNSA